MYKQGTLEKSMKGYFLLFSKNGDLAIKELKGNK